MIVSARYKMVLLKSTCAVKDSGEEVFILLDDEIFPKQGESWDPIIQWAGQIMRMQTLSVDRLTELSPGTYELEVQWLDDQGVVEHRFNHALGYDVPMRGKLRLERAEDG